MEAKNLRIGNLVNYVTKDNAKARAVDAELLMNWKDNYRMYKPITLTEEWLKKLGFTEVENDSYINGKQWLMQVTDDYIDEEADEIINRDGTWFDGIGTYQFKSIGAMAVSVLCRGNYVCGSVGTVHELQNLFFALSGRELELKSQS